MGVVKKKQRKERVLAGELNLAQGGAQWFANTL
jgi:hypothetical protein